VFPYVGDHGIAHISWDSKEVAFGCKMLGPLALRPVSGFGEGPYAFFEAWWRAGEKYVDIDHAVSKAWWLKQKKGTRVYPKAKGKAVEYRSWGTGPAMDLVTARARALVPTYEALVGTSVRLSQLREYLRGNGKPLVLYCNDGPRDAFGRPCVMPVTAEEMKKYLQDPTKPFGPDFVFAAMVAGIPSADYTAL